MHLVYAFSAPHTTQCSQSPRPPRMPLGVCCIGAAAAERERPPLWARPATLGGRNAHAVDRPHALAQRASRPAALSHTQSTHSVSAHSQLECSRCRPPCAARRACVSGQDLGLRRALLRALARDDADQGGLARQPRPAVARTSAPQGARPSPSFLLLPLLASAETPRLQSTHRVPTRRAERMHAGGQRPPHRHARPPLPRGIQVVPSGAPAV